MANPPASTTPEAALARHLEWLEFALAAARDEESRRQARLERATDKNRDKRAVKLAEVSAEVRELAALVQGIRDLQAHAAQAGASSKAATQAAAKLPAKGSPAASPKPRPSGTSRRASAKEVAPTAKQVAPTAKQVAPTAKQVAPTAKAEAPRAASRRGRRNGNGTGPDEPSS